MVSHAFARLAVGVLGNIVSLFLYLSPVPTFIGIWKKGSVEQYSSTTYIVTFMNCMLWTLYGMPFVHQNSILVSTISGIGCLIELTYLLLFVIYSSNNKKRIILVLIILFEVVVVAVTLALLLCFTHTTNRRSQIIGLLGDFSCIVMYASPLSVMKQVITTKSVEFMPLAISVTSFANALIWTLYAIHPLDPYVAMPNGLGCLLGLAQLILYATYYKSTKEQLTARKAAEKVEIGLKEVIVVTRESSKVNNVSEDAHSTPKDNEA